MVRFHDISYNGKWLRDVFSDNVLVISTIPKGMDSDGKRKIPVPIVIRKDVQKTIDSLNEIFRERDKRLILKVQPDRYYVASLNTEIDPSSAVKNAEITLEFEAEDGYAYSVNKKRFTATSASEIEVVNDGTASTYPTVTVTNKSDNGWIGIINETGIFGAGEGSSVDMDEKPDREMLIPGLNSFANGRTTSIPTGDIAQGTLAVSGSQIVLGAKGPWGDGKKWCGGYNVANITSAGAGTGNKQFYAHFKIEAETGKVQQTGLIKILFLDSNNKIVAMYDVHKASTSQNKADFIMYYGGNSIRRRETFDFTPSYKETENPFRATTHGSIDLVKTGAKLSFYWWSKRYDVDVPELADVAIAKVGIFIGQYGTRDIIPIHYFTHFRIKAFSAEQRNLDKISGVKNLFLASDVLTVDMETTDITINSTPRADVFTRGGDFISIPPGTTKIQLDRSDWSDDVDVIVEFRERWY